MNINDLITDIGRAVTEKRDIIDTLKKHGKDPTSSARVSYALLEIGLEGFKAAGMGPFLAMALVQMIAHGATVERALKAVMLIQDEDDMKDQIDPRRVEARKAAAEAHDDPEPDDDDATAKKRRVM